MSTETGTQTQATTTTPEENLALRYGYAQLDPAHKAMADRIAALIIAYPDITALNDPAKQQAMVADVMNAPSTKEAVAKLGAVGGETRNLLRQVPGFGELIGATETAQGVATGAAQVTGAVTQGVGAVALPFTMTTEGAAEFYNQLKVLGNQLSVEQAQSVGAAYASVFQARAEDRAEKGVVKGVFSSDMFSYLGALFAWAYDFVRSMPVIGDLVQKLDTRPVRNWEEHLQRAMNEADIKATRGALVDAHEINGVDTRHWGELLTTGGAVQNRAGQDTNVVAPTKNNPIPTLPDAPMNAHGLPVVAQTDATAVVGDALNRGSNAFMQPVQRVAAHIGGPATAAGVVAGAALGADAAVGVGQGMTRQFLGEKSGPAMRAGKDARTIGNLRIEAAKLREGDSGVRFWENDAAREARAAKLEARAEAMEHKPSIARNARVAESRTHLSGKLGSVVDDALEPKTGLLRTGRNVGRVMGDIGGVVVERTAHLSATAIGKIPLIGRGLVEATPAMGGAIARMGARAVPVVAVAAPAIDVVDLGAGLMNNDDRQAITAGTRLGTVGAGAATGAGIGAFFGGVGALPGAAIGAAVGGIASIGTGWGAGKMYDRHQAKQTHSVPETDPGIAAAVAASHGNMQQAQAAAGAVARGMKARSVSMAATLPVDQNDTAVNLAAATRRTGNTISANA